MVIDLNGFDFFWETIGEGEPLLWLHGVLGSGADWRSIFKEAPAGFRLIAPDLRGHVDQPLRDVLIPPVRARRAGAPPPSRPSADQGHRPERRRPHAAAHGH